MTSNILKSRNNTLQKIDDNKYKVSSKREIDRKNEEDKKLEHDNDTQEFSGWEEEYKKYIKLQKTKFMEPFSGTINQGEKEIEFYENTIKDLVVRYFKFFYHDFLNPESINSYKFNPESASVDLFDPEYCYIDCYEKKYEHVYKKAVIVTDMYKDLQKTYEQEKKPLTYTFSYPLYYKLEKFLWKIVDFFLEKKYEHYIIKKLYSPLSDLSKAFETELEKNDEYDEKLKEEIYKIIKKISEFSGKFKEGKKVADQLGINESEFNSLLEESNRKEKSDKSRPDPLLQVMIDDAKIINYEYNKSIKYNQLIKDSSEKFEDMKNFCVSFQNLDQENYERLLKNYVKYNNEEKYRGIINYIVSALEKYRKCKIYVYKYSPENYISTFDAKSPRETAQNQFGKSISKEKIQYFCGMLTKTLDPRVITDKSVLKLFHGIAKKKYDDTHKNTHKNTYGDTHKDKSRNNILIRFIINSYHYSKFYSNPNRQSVIYNSISGTDKILRIKYFEREIYLIKNNPSSTFSLKPGNNSLSSKTLYDMFLESRDTPSVYVNYIMAVNPPNIINELFDHFNLSECRYNNMYSGKNMVFLDCMSAVFPPLIKTAYKFREIYNFAEENLTIQCDKILENNKTLETMSNLIDIHKTVKDNLQKLFIKIEEYKKSISSHETYKFVEFLRMDINNFEDTKKLVKYIIDINTSLMIINWIITYSNKNIVNNLGNFIIYTDEGVFDILDSFFKTENIAFFKNLPITVPSFFNEPV